MKALSSFLCVVVLLSAPVTRAERRDGRLSRADLAPIFRDPRATVALTLLRSGNPQEALDRLRPLAYGKARPEHVERLRFLIALAAAQVRDHETVLTALQGLEDLVPIVADHVRFLRGRALAALGRHREAVEVLSAIPPDSPVGRKARLVLGDSLTALGRPADAAAAYQAVFDGGRRDPEVAQKLASALAASGRKDEAVSMLRRLYFRTAGAGRSAYGKALESLGASLAPREAERLDQAGALLDIHASQDAIRATDALTRSQDPAIRCGALWVKARALTKLRRHAQAWPLFRRVIEECDGRLDMASALYHAARSALRGGRDADLARLASRLRERFPDSTLNDDIATWRARVALKGGREREAERILEDSLKAWPDGDMALESAWLLAWGAFCDRDYNKALRRMQAGLDLAVARHDPDYGARFAYWKARTLAHLGRKKAAREADESCVRDFPMTYYAHLALARLAGRRSPESVLGHLATKPPCGPFFTPTSPSSLRDGPVARALWFAQTGLLDLALDEVGPADPAAPDQAWFQAILLDEAGDARRAHRVAAETLKAAGGFWPDDATADYYRVSYPRPFRDVVERAARESRVDPLLLWALMRQESAFNPSVESHANALGLMQLILPTAREMAKSLKLTATPETLRRPEVNVRLGAAYIARLLRRFRNPLLAIPGYNAGGGAVASWLQAHPGVPLDVFVEEIGAEETRNYARKVFESYAAYRFLYGEGRERFVPIRFER